MSDLYLFDKQYNKIVLGVDEAGRGPLAGPVVAAAVIVKNPEALYAVNDSKKLSEKKREKLYQIIMDNCEVGVGIVDNIIIDEINILNATFMAMREAVNNIKSGFDIILVDGNHKIRELNLYQEAVVKGDGKSLSIAAASIVAKVTRDRLMIHYHEKYPSYNFDGHKGYGTAKHIEALKNCGPCEIHRKSFIKGILNN